jgi:hypothetical protein
MKDILLQILLSAGTSLIGYVLGYRKSKNEIEGGRLENLEKSLTIYQTLIDDLSRKVEDLSTHIVRLELTIDSLKQENRKLKGSI